MLPRTTARHDPAREDGGERLAREGDEPRQPAAFHAVRRSEGGTWVPSVYPQPRYVWAI
jgi:hypothetical protein